MGEGTFVFYCPSFTTKVFVEIRIYFIKYIRTSLIPCFIIPIVPGIAILAITCVASIVVC